MNEEQDHRMRNVAVLLLSLLMLLAVDTKKVIRITIMETTIYNYLRTAR